MVTGSPPLVFCISPTVQILDVFGLYFPMVGRDALVEGVVSRSWVVQRATVLVSPGAGTIESDKDSANIIALQGGPGTGKSKLATELPRAMAAAVIAQLGIESVAVPSPVDGSGDATASASTARNDSAVAVKLKQLFLNHVEIRLTFANGTPFDESEKLHDGQHILAVRMLLAAFPSLRPAGEAFKDVMARHLGCGLRVHHIIEMVCEAKNNGSGVPEVTSDGPPVFVSVVIDEAHVLIPDAADGKPGWVLLLSVELPAHCVGSLFLAASRLVRIPLQVEAVAVAEATDRHNGVSTGWQVEGAAAASHRWD